MSSIDSTPPDASSGTRAERMRVSFRVVWDDGESYFTATVSNISESGIFIETPLPAPIGAEVTIVPLVDGQGTLFELHGRVVRRLEDQETETIDVESGMGIKFLNMKDEQRHELRQLLSQYRTGK